MNKKSTYSDTSLGDKVFKILPDFVYNANRHKGKLFTYTPIKSAKMLIDIANEYLSYRRCAQTMLAKANEEILSLRANLDTVRKLYNKNIEK